MTTSLARRAIAERRGFAERRGRRVLALVVLGVLSMLACAASIAYGARPIPLEVVWQALVDPNGTPAHLVVNELRMPRTILGIMVGVALGIAGALMQGHTRNPIADPGLLGVNQGAAFGIVLAVVAFGVQSLYVYIWFGFAGALLASVAVFLLGAVAGRGSTPVTLALAGAAVSALLYGLISMVVLGSHRGMQVYRFWHVGSIAGRDFTIAGQVAPFLLLGLVLALVNTPGMNTLALGEDVATSLGQNIRRSRVLGVLAITLLSGAAVAACGPIAFLGLVVPHMARAMTGPDYRWLVPVSGLLGAVLLLFADVAARLLSDDKLEVGIMLALIGAPVFIFLVRRKGLSRL